MRSRSLRPHRVRPTTALALITLCLAGAAAQASTPAEVAVPRRLVPEPIPVRVPAAVPAPVAPVQAAPVQQSAPEVVPATFTRTGIPANLLAAYRSAEALLARTHGGCGLRWYHLAGIGHVESAHARGGQADPVGDTSPRILGPALTGGPGMATIIDTDGGSLDGDRVWDRAVGPMQFIPSTWSFYRTDGNADGATNPHNIHDAAAAAGRYLCSGGMNLSTPTDLSAAVYRYNHSTEYVSTVLMWMHRYSEGATPLPPRPPSSTPGSRTPPAAYRPTGQLLAGAAHHLPIPVEQPTPLAPPLDPPPPPDIPLPEPIEPPKPAPTPMPTPEPIPAPEPTPTPPTDCATQPAPPPTPPTNPEPVPTPPPSDPEVAPTPPPTNNEALPTPAPSTDHETLPANTPEPALPTPREALDLPQSAPNHEALLAPLPGIVEDLITTCSSEPTTAPTAPSNTAAEPTKAERPRPAHLVRPTKTPHK